ncbi:MAG: nitroreductase family protein [Campylobacterales bacterium]
MHYHDRTVHTRQSVRQPHFLDWDTQPSAFKRYPHFLPRIRFDTLADRDFWPLLNGITQSVQTVSGPYALRTAPSAGALYPVELYVQSRGRGDLADGLYHYAANENALVRIAALGTGSGIEPFLGVGAVDGLVFALSSPWFRSAWKYRLRSFRYCGLDTGHLAGAIEAACGAAGKPFALWTGFDKPGLAAKLGLNAQEWVMAAAIAGTIGEAPARPIAENLMQVPPTDYFEPWPQLIAAYHETLETAGEKPAPRTPSAVDRAVILNRRSIRNFTGGGMDKSELEALWQTLEAPPEITLWTVAHNVRGMEAGLYKNGVPARGGDFRALGMGLCLEQRLGGEGGALFFLTGKGDRYQSLMIQAGLIGQRLYLAAHGLGLGVSGIGAFYDGEVQAFLETDEWVLYALAAGR